MKTKDLLGDMEFEHLPDWIENLSRDRAFNGAARQLDVQTSVDHKRSRYPYAGLRNIPIFRVKHSPEFLAFPP